MTYFTSEQHKESFEFFLQEAQVGKGEWTAQAVLYLLSAVPAIERNIGDFYELSGKYIILDGVERNALSPGERMVVAIAFNLYNGLAIDGIHLRPSDILSTLDNELKKCYIHALEMNMGLANVA